MEKFDLHSFHSPDAWQRIRAAADVRSTPFLLIDLARVREKYLELRRGLPGAAIHYAVKANPAPEILGLLASLGSSFDIASRNELDRLLSLGIGPERLSYSNTIKKAADVRHAFERGVRLFASDAEMDVRRIAEQAPGSELCVRILTEGTETSDWPLCHKFGCQTETAIDLMLLARQLGLQPSGISFHVGSQQRDPSAWEAAIAKVKFISDRLAQHGIRLRRINMGGGFPATYVNRTQDVAHYCAEIRRFLDADFGDDVPELMLEPGRSVVGDAGVLVSEVVLVARKARYDPHRWVFVDVGLFGGLIETLGEAIRYPIYCERGEDPNAEVEDVVLAGPTCDGIDVMYKNHKYALPMSLRAGDRLYWLSTGAYTASYSSVEFNGFPPLPVHFV